MWVRLDVSMSRRGDVADGRSGRVVGPRWSILGGAVDLQATAIPRRVELCVLAVLRSLPFIGSGASLALWPLAAIRQLI